MNSYELYPYFKRKEKDQNGDFTYRRFIFNQQVWHSSSKLIQALKVRTIEKNKNFKEVFRLFSLFFRQRARVHTYLAAMRAFAWVARAAF